ncbi:MAG: alpha/beta fold hydrolase [Polyangiales bacterium]
MKSLRAGLLGFAMMLAVQAVGFASTPTYKEIDFPTEGGIHARADLYTTDDKSATLIILFHQAGWSRGEYREIAPKLVARGYQVMAVDQRAGRGVNGVRNETHRRAATKGLATQYLDGFADLVAALSYARDTLKAERVIVWGSSYSASLVFRLAAEKPDHVSAVLAFSPGEYFRHQGADYVRTHAKKVSIPVFVTSSKSERDQVKPIFDAVPAQKKILFTPASLGQHGSRALWRKWDDNDVYWAALAGFLQEYAPPVVK